MYRHSSNNNPWAAGRTPLQSAYTEPIGVCQPQYEADDIVRNVSCVPGQPQLRRGASSLMSAVSRGVHTVGRWLTALAELNFVEDSIDEFTELSYEGDSFRRSGEGEVRTAETGLGLWGQRG